jgi:regulatory protein
MKILKIEKVKLKKDTFRIFFDNDDSITVLADSIVKFCLKEGQELQEKEYEEVVSYDKSNRIMSDAFSLVAAKSYSSKGLQDKLLQKGYDKDKVLNAVLRLEELNYINDERFSKNYAIYLSQKGKGEFVIKADLERQGINKSLMIEALNAVKSQVEPYEQIVKILHSKFKKFNGKDKNEVRRIASFFLRRGFSSENIAKAFREYKDIFIE